LALLGNAKPSGESRSCHHGPIPALAAENDEMNNDRELTHAALQWHIAHVRRMAIGTAKRKLDAQLKARGDCGWALQLYSQQCEAARQLTEAKCKELAALRLLAKACAKQRGHLELSDVIDLDGAITLLPAAV
jgi:hypothetical protein